MPVTVYAWASASVRGRISPVAPDGWIWLVKPATMMTQEVMTHEAQTSNVFKYSYQNVMLHAQPLPYYSVFLITESWMMQKYEKSCIFILLK